jgi:hypothetical protein
MHKSLFSVTALVGLVAILGVASVGAAQAGVTVRAPSGVLVVVDWSGAGPLVTVDVKKKRRATVK